MEPTSDAWQIQRSRHDPEAFGLIFDRHAPVVLAYLVRRVGRNDAEALLGDLFRIAFERRASYDLSRESARPWLYGIAANLVMKHHRAAGRHLRAVDRLGAQPVPETEFEQAVVQDLDRARRWRRLRTAIDQLAEQDREVLLLFAWEDLSYEQIAEALAIPVGTVRSRLHRVRRTLRELRDVTGEVPATNQRVREGVER